LRSNTGDFSKPMVWAEMVMKFAVGSRSKQMKKHLKKNL
jgi:hypothetical protein